MILLADRVVVCLFDQAGCERQVELPEVDGFIWHGYLPGIGPGQRYAYRVYGPHDPPAGLRCNPAKLLLDSYAKAIDGPLTWDGSLFGYWWGDPDSSNTTDSAPYLSKCVVVNPCFDWGPRSPPAPSVSRDRDLRGARAGLTMRHPEVPVELRGTYAGLMHPAVTDHLASIGVTAVELMPVQHYLDDHHLVGRGQRNYWGYNTIGFFAPYAGYAAWRTTGQQVQEFKAMVKTLHEASIEVILDVVYNHTAEGNHLGPTVAFRGVDNPAYYRLAEPVRRYYIDYTGTGNTLNVRHLHSLQLIMDSLRYWILEMHVDGFRFDLAGPSTCWQGRLRGSRSVAAVASYAGFRYPVEIISHAVWLYFRFALSFRDVSELVLARGVVVSHETIRQWARKFGQDYANALRRRRPRPGDKWHMDEVFVKINGVRHYLWRAVDQDGVVLDVLVQRRRDAAAAKKLFRKLLKGLRYVPRMIVTDRLGSYQVAHRVMLGSVEHRRSKYLNNRAENSHQCTRVRERTMKHFHSAGQAQRFCSAHGPISSHFRPGRHLMSGSEWRREMSQRFTTWNEVTGVAAAA